MPHLHLDCPSGLGGDMFLAAMCDLGFSISALEEILRRAGLDVTLRAEACRSQGLAGRRLELDLPGRQPLRHLKDVQDVIGRLDLPRAVKTRASAAFVRLAEVEAAAHGCALEEVHFHEVGALDSIVDVAGACLALHALNIGRVTCSSLPWFEGEVRTAHGLMSLPAPATLRLLTGKPVRPTDFRREIITPTGALILDQIVDEFLPGPRGRVLGSGLGLGELDLSPAPNGLRAILFEPEAEAPGDEIMVIESNIDHLTGEELGACFEALTQAGAVDVAFIPAVMKKNRPGGILQTMCPPEVFPAVRQAYFKHTLTLGARIRRERREILPRRASSLDTPHGHIPAKEFELDGERFSRAEFEALKALAAKTGRSIPELRLMLFGQP